MREGRRAAPLLTGLELYQTQNWNETVKEGDRLSEGCNFEEVCKAR